MENTEKERDLNISAHASHCCEDHGCKYGDDDCPVVSGEADQLYPCESCGNEKRQIDAAMKVATEHKMISDTPENREIVLKMISAGNQAFYEY